MALQITCQSSADPQSSLAFQTRLAELSQRLSESHPAPPQDAHTQRLWNHARLNDGWNLGGNKTLALWYGTSPDCRDCITLHR